MFDTFRIVNDNNPSPDAFEDGNYLRCNFCNSMVETGIFNLIDHVQSCVEAKEEQQRRLMKNLSELLFRP